MLCGLTINCQQFQSSNWYPGFCQENKYVSKKSIWHPIFTDVDEPIADGFYFTIAYPGFSGEELLGELIYYGISAISLAITGSERTEGIRACVSLVQREQFPDLEFRLKKFYEHHPEKEKQF